MESAIKIKNWIVASVPAVAFALYSTFKTNDLPTVIVIFGVFFLVLFLGWFSNYGWGAFLNISPFRRWLLEAKTPEGFWILRTLPFAVHDAEVSTDPRKALPDALVEFRFNADLRLEVLATRPLPEHSDDMSVDTQSFSTLFRESDGAYYNQFWVQIPGEIAHKGVAFGSFYKDAGSHQLDRYKGKIIYPGNVGILTQVGVRVDIGIFKDYKDKYGSNWISKLADDAFGSKSRAI